MSVLLLSAEHNTHTHTHTHTHSWQPLCVAAVPGPDRVPAGASDGSAELCDRSARAIQQHGHVLLCITWLSIAWLIWVGCLIVMRLWHDNWCKLCIDNPGEHAANPNSKTVSRWGL